MGTEDFNGRTALITGAASGIGAGCAKWLDRHGISELILVDLDEAGLAALDLSCQVRTYAGSVADPALWERVEAETGRLDHALVNAGVANGGKLVDTDFAEWRRIQSVNLDGAFLTLRAALRLMQRCGEGKSVVLTASSAGVKPSPGAAAYGSSKAAVIHLAKAAAAEHLAEGIRINAVAPGRVDTPIWTTTDHFKAIEAKLGDRQAALEAVASQLDAVGSFTTVDVLADQIGFLLSDRASNITGTVLLSDGGYCL